eukprot:NODE_475_length_6994_cov_1.213198.p1 type:complete len:1721 gc:universal NODE_475_length_6994_cov_1.213198:1047-6209(+)
MDSSAFDETSSNLFSFDNYQGDEQTSLSFQEANRNLNINKNPDDLDYFFDLSIDDQIQVLAMTEANKILYYESESRRLNNESKIVNNELNLRNNFETNTQDCNKINVLPLTNAEQLSNEPAKNSVDVAINVQSTKSKLRQNIFQYVKDISEDRKKEMNLQLFEYKCSTCGAIRKRSALKLEVGYKKIDKNLQKFICKNKKCITLKLDKIPDVLSLLSQEEIQNLRLVKVFSHFEPPTDFEYQRFKNETSLSTNLEAWMHCSGLVSFNMPYSKKSNYQLTELGFQALDYLKKNNKFYQRNIINKDLFELIACTPDRVLTNKDGELSIKIIKKDLPKGVGNEDFDIDRLPVAAYKFKNKKKITQSKLNIKTESQLNKNEPEFRPLSFTEEMQNTAREIFGYSKNSPDIEALIFFDKYPTGDNGIARYGKKSKEVKDRLFHEDGRFRNSPEWICFMNDLMEKQLLHFQQLRVQNDPTKQYVKKDLVEPSKYIPGRMKISEDLTSPLPIQIRGGAAYFNSVKCNLREFIRENGRPHLFVTFSVDETTNSDLNDIISKFEGSNIVFESSEPLHIQFPFLSTITNYEMLRGMFSYIKKKGIDGLQVLHSFYRIEFQKRGSPHIHMLLWMDINKMEELLPLISCKLPSFETDPILNQLVRTYQVHHCTKNYCKKLSSDCRFGYPKKRVSKPNHFVSGSNHYELHRSTHELNVNAYNEKLLKLWCGNMDIQIVTTDSYVTYLMKYINKTEPEELVKNIGSVGGYLRCLNRSIPEVIFYALGLRITEFSTEVIQIGISRDLLDKRVLKKLNDILKEKQNSTDNFLSNAVDRYLERDCYENPELKEVCLHDFYKYYKKQAKTGLIIKRVKPCIVRHYPFLNEFDGEDYFIQKLLLYTPFTNVKEILNIGLKSTFRNYAKDKLNHILTSVPNIIDSIDEVHNNQNSYELDIRRMFNIYPKANSPISITSLNDMQYDIYETITKSNEKYFMINGGPGTGKSYLCNAISQFCSRPESGINCVSAGSTGLASMLIGGATIHSLLVLNKNNDTWQSLIQTPKHSAKLNFIKSLDFLIIDEVSMIGQFLFEKCLEIVETNCKSTVKLIMVGDFDQLKPVKEPSLESSIKIEEFRVFELNENMRVECELLAAAIQAIRESDFGKFNECIKDRIVSSLHNDEIPAVFAHRDDSKIYNERILNKFATARRETIYELSFPGTNIPPDLESEFRMDKVLEICVGCRVILLANLSVEKGLVNGSIGTVTDIKYNTLLNAATEILVKFTTTIGNSEVTLTPTEETHEKYTRHQFPITLAYSLTVHKIQGMTLSSIAISKIFKYWDKSLLYVAISRVKKLEHIYIVVPNGKVLDISSYDEMFLNLEGKDSKTFTTIYNDENIDILLERSLNTNRVILSPIKLSENGNNVVAKAEIKPKPTFKELARAPSPKKQFKKLNEKKSYKIIKNLVDSKLDSHIISRKNIINNVHNFLPLQLNQYPKSIAALLHMNFSPSLNLHLNDEPMPNFRFPLQIGRFSIERIDFITLDNTAWLCDDIINSYSFLLSVEDLRVFCLHSHFATKLRDPNESNPHRFVRRENIFEDDLLVIPIHYGNHWAAAFILNNLNTIVLVNSIKNNISRDNGTLTKLRDFIDTEHQKRYNSSVQYNTINLIGNPLQPNGYDCGVYTLAAIEVFVKNVDILNTLQNVTNDTLVELLHFGATDMPVMRCKVAHAFIQASIMYASNY